MLQGVGHGETGSAALLSARRRIYAVRALRDFGDGFVAVLLPVYLTAIGMDAFQVGLVATLALLGSALTTLAIGLVGARIDQRVLLKGAAALMAATGIAFAVSTATAVVLLIAFVGTINPSAGSVSIFVPLEHALLSGLAADKDRTSTFARYGLIGSMAAAAGALASATPDMLAALGLSRVTALKAMFVVYALLGVAGGFLYANVRAPGRTVADEPHAALGPGHARPRDLRPDGEVHLQEENHCAAEERFREGRRHVRERCGKARRKSGANSSTPPSAARPLSIRADHPRDGAL